jgi:hypothetical protein
MNYKQKQSLWCEITIENYKESYPLLNLHDFCPCCFSNNTESYFYNHKKKIKYFYAYPLHKETNMKPYLYDDVTNVLYLVDDIS